MNPPLSPWDPRFPSVSRMVPSVAPVNPPELRPEGGQLPNLDAQEAPAPGIYGFMGFMGFMGFIAIPGTQGLESEGKSPGGSMGYSES